MLELAVDFVQGLKSANLAVRIKICWTRSRRLVCKIWLSVVLFAVKPIAKISQALSNMISKYSSPSFRTIRYMSWIFTMWRGWKLKGVFTQTFRRAWLFDLVRYSASYSLLPCNKAFDVILKHFMKFCSCGPSCSWILCKALCHTLQATAK